MQNQLESKAYAGFFVRLIAYCIDLLIAAIVVGMVKIPFSIAASSGADFLKSNFIFDYSFLDVLGYVGIAAYFVLLTYFAHTTVGKMLFRLEVECDKEWTFINVLYRETIGRFLSSLLDIGYLAVIVQKEKQGFHDMLCDTHVIYKNMYKREKETVSPSVVAVNEMVNPGGVDFAAVTEGASVSGETSIVESVTQAERTPESEKQAEDMTTADAEKQAEHTPEGEKHSEDMTTADAEKQAEHTLEGEKQSEDMTTADAKMQAEHTSEGETQVKESGREQSWTYYQPKQPETEQRTSAFEVTESHPIEAETQNIE